jgi:hypothetical protein
MHEALGSIPSTMKKKEKNVYFINIIDYCIKTSTVPGDDEGEKHKHIVSILTVLRSQ